jgi:hypothetical protein
MNTPVEIRQAIDDFQSGKMGQLSCALSAKAEGFRPH